jgi:hypothetical protein
MIQKKTVPEEDLASVKEFAKYEEPVVKEEVVMILHRYKHS